MEPIAASSAAQGLRPLATALQGELSAVLREGRILVGEVLARPGDGTLLIAVGRQRVPARSDVALQPGQAFLFRVLREGDGLVLSVLGQGDGAESELLAALRRVIGEERPLAEVLGTLAARLRAELARPGAALEDLLRLASALDARVFRPGSVGEELRSLLARSGLRYESALWNAARTGLGAELLARLSQDFKAELLRAFERLADGPARDAVARALAGLEAEQLLNHARARAGEPQVFGFPVPDGAGGAGWTTARLVVSPREEGQKGPGGSEGETRRVVLGVSFSRTGPVRADLVLTAAGLHAQILVARRELAEALARDHDELVQLLGGERRVQLHSRLGSLAEVSVGDNPLDVRFLRENHLMDVSG
jgi:hypothetical protein